jgi:hypothetical protein
MPAMPASPTALHPLGHDPLEGYVAGWLDENASSTKTLATYADTMRAFRAAQAARGLGSLPGLVAAVAQQWSKVRADGREGEASAATQNQRLAILSSFYRYANRMLDAGATIALLRAHPRPVVACLEYRGTDEGAMEVLAAVEAEGGPLRRHGYILLNAHYLLQQPEHRQRIFRMGVWLLSIPFDTGELLRTIEAASASCHA